MRDEVILYWGTMIDVLAERGLLQERLPSGDVVVPEAEAYVLPERVIFVLDLQHLGGIPLEVWLDERLWARWRAALAGRRVFVTKDEGLAITVSRDPVVPSAGAPAQR
jgi:hypothetical protein